MAYKGQFKSGKSGNPGGRPALAPEVRTQAQEKAPEAFKRVCELVNDDDQRVALAACNVVLERAYGRTATERPTINLDMPKIENSESLLQAMSGILIAVSNGKISPVDAKEVAGLIEVHRKTIETTELDQRISVLEGKSK